MKTIQMTMEEGLLIQMDREVKQRKTSRSAFTREAIRHYLSVLKEQELERKHREGYRKKPVPPGEFSDWESEQIWPE